MKKRLIIISVLTTLFLLMCVSCKTTPAETPDRADEARRRAVDFEAPAYFPSEWETAEAHYNVGTFEVAADAYDELFNKAVPLYAQAREDEIMAIREEVKDSGFSQAYPEYLRNADEIALTAYAQYEAEEYYQAKETAATAMEEYSTLLVGVKVYHARQEIVDRGFSQYDQDNFDKAEETSLSALAKYDEGDKPGAVEAAEEALLRYNLVIANGWTFYAAERQASAANERELALAEKANIASRETFRGAEELFNQAQDFLEKEMFDSAGILFIDSEARFAIARHDTEQKRLNAEETIKLAEERILESDGTALEAERMIEGGTR